MSSEREVIKDAGTGQFVSDAEAEARPGETYRQTVGRVRITELQTALRAVIAILERIDPIVTHDEFEAWDAARNLLD